VDVNLGAIAPELVLVATAAIILLGDLVAQRGMPRNVVLMVALVGLAVAAMATGPLLGQQFLAFSGSIAVDPFAVYFKLLFIGTAALILLASTGFLDDAARYRSEFVGLLLLATTALMLMAAASDLITMYIALEMSSLSIAFLSAWQKRDLRSTEAGLKYFLLSAMSSAVLLYGMAIVYGVTGQVHLGAIAQELGGRPSVALFLGLTMILAGFGFKVSAVPFQMWTPDVYEGAPTVVTAFLSVASKSAGFAALIRVLTVALPAERADWMVLIAILALATMTVGNIVALVQANVKRMLAYSSIAQAGYVLVGIASGTAEGISAVLFYLLAYTATNLGAFIAVIGITRAIGSERIADFRGLHHRAPGLAFALAVSLFSLAGLPPFVGFFAKLYVFWAAAQSGLLWLVLAAVINSAISLYYYAQVVHDMYLLPAPEEAPALDATQTRPAPTIVSLGLAIAGVLLLGVFSGTFFSIQNVAASALAR
jgi:NADH-quinone oxidoreductase subunit N